MTYRYNKATLDLIKSFESLHDGDLRAIGLQPKMDPIGIWTEGYGRAMIDPRTKGHLRGVSNKDLAYKLASIKTEEEAIKALNNDLTRLAYKPILAILDGDRWVSLTDNQQGALSSFVYNCGVGRPQYKIFNNIIKWLEKEMSNEALASYWNSSVVKANGKELAGLVRRRRAESNLFFQA